jgi:hypothetical protein
VKPAKLTGTVPRLKKRAGVLPTKVERDKSKDPPRRAKHRRPPPDETA